MKIFQFLILLFLLHATVECQSVELITVEGTEFSEVVRYILSGENKPERIVLWKDQDNRIRDHFGDDRSTLINGRYLVSPWGDLLDLATSILLLCDQGLLVAHTNQTLILSQVKGAYKTYLQFDLKDKQLKAIKFDQTWEMPGILSPDGMHSVCADDFSGSSVWLYSKEGKRRLLIKDFQAVVSWRTTDFFDRLPLLWIDDSHILTQNGNGKLMVVNLRGKTKRLLTIPCEQRPVSVPTLSRDLDNQIIYRCGEKSFVIDIEKCSWEDYSWIPLGNGYRCSERVDVKCGQRLFSGLRDLGCHWVDIVRSKSINGYLVLPYGEVGSNLAYPAGLMIWSDRKSGWYTIQLKNLRCILSISEN